MKEQEEITKGIEDGLTDQEIKRYFKPTVTKKLALNCNHGR